MSFESIEIIEMSYQDFKSQIRPSAELTIATSRAPKKTDKRNVSEDHVFYLKNAKDWYDSNSGKHYFYDFLNRPENNHLLNQFNANNVENEYQQLLAQKINDSNSINAANSVSVQTHGGSRVPLRPLVF